MNLDAVFFDNAVRQWLLATAVAVGAAAAFAIVRRVAITRVTRFAERTATRVDDLFAAVLAATRSWFVAGAGLYVGTTMLTVSGRWSERLDALVVVALVLQGGLWATAAAGYVLETYRRDKLENAPGTATMIGALRYVVTGTIWVAVLLAALDNAGVEVTTLVTGLGIGGIAIALAVQNIFGDLLASLAIVFDKPFVLGDFIAVDAKVGTVEHIGLKTTRVRALSGEQLVFSNADLISARIHNFGRMQQRRVAFTLGVTYQTPRALLERIPALVEEAIAGDETVRFDRCHLANFGDSSIDFETVYFVATDDYVQFMDARQRMFLRIHEAFERDGISFAYPTQTLIVEGGPNPLV